jgi:HD-GYP domain-containing protein (c-di-GMP phosphodiesterase class II)
MASQPQTNEKSAPSFLPAVGTVAPPSTPSADGGIQQLNSLIQQIEADSAAEGRPAAVSSVRPAENQLVEVRLGIASSLYRALRWKHEPTARHCFRVTLLCSSWATRLGLSPKEHDEIELAALLHDIGKVGVPDSILNKPGRLTPEEMQQMRLHTVYGYEILSGSSSKLIQLAADIALSHHERFDGGGYPNRLRGEEIPLAARIVSVADVFDALTSARSYKPVWSVDEALYYLIQERGGQFDPVCVDAFLSRRQIVAPLANAGAEAALVQ